MMSDKEYELIEYGWKHDPSERLIINDFVVLLETEVMKLKNA